MTIRRLTDPERFRTTYYGARRYIDPLPACELAEPTGDKERLPNGTSIAKEVGSQSFFKKLGDARVPLDALRVAEYAIDAWDRLAEMPDDERRLALAQSAGRDLARAAERGTAVHALIEALLRGEQPMLLEAEAEQYADVAQQVATEFAELDITHQEVVAFYRGDEFVNYGGTFDAWGEHTLRDWKTRGPDAKHGCYEKEVAQLGLGAICEYWIAERNGEAVRVPTPTFDRMEVVSIRPDGFEVFDVDPALAIETAQRALAIHDHRKKGAAAARRATAAPRQIAAAGTNTPTGGAVESTSVSPPPSSSDASALPASDASAPLSHRDTATPGPTPSQIEWFRDRYAALIAAGVTAEQIATVWPAGVPGPKKVDTFDGEEFAVAVTALGRLEGDAGMPFGEPDPAEKPEPRKLRVIPVTGDDDELPTPEDSGELIDDEAVQALKRQFSTLDKAEQTAILTWRAEGNEAKRPWSTAGESVLERRWCISRAAVRLAMAAEPLEDEVARAWISLVIGEDAVQRHPVGALLGTLTKVEADRLADLCDTGSFAAAIAAAS